MDLYTLRNITKNISNMPRNLQSNYYVLSADIFKLTSFLIHEKEPALTISTINGDREVDYKLLGEEHIKNFLKKSNIPENIEYTTALKEYRLTKKYINVLFTAYENKYVGILL